MNMSIRRVACVSAAAMLCLSNTAIAGDAKFGVLVGGSVSNDNGESSTTAITLGGMPTTYGYDISAKSKTGYLVGGSVSYWTDSGLIYEAELSYRRNRYTIDGDIFFSNGAQSDSLVTSGAATADAYTAMANVWYEFGARSDRPVRPYIGGGAGVADINANGQFTATGTALGFAIDNITDITGSDTQLAWQLGAGINYHLATDAVVSLGYRYMDTGDISSGLSNGYNTHSLIASIRF